MSDGGHVDGMNVRVEQEDRGWMVFADVDGERKEFGDPHPSREDAEKHAKHLFSAADRWTDAATKVDPEPAKFPGDGES